MSATELTETVCPLCGHHSPLYRRTPHSDVLACLECWTTEMAKDVA